MSPRYGGTGVLADELSDGAIAVFVLDLGEIGFEVADPAWSRKIVVSAVASLS
jgi:hypothetical protein